MGSTRIRTKNWLCGPWALLVTVVISSGVQVGRGRAASGLAAAEAAAAAAARGEQGGRELRTDFRLRFMKEEEGSNYA